MVFQGNTVKKFSENGCIQVSVIRPPWTQKEKPQVETVVR